MPFQSKRLRVQIPCGEGTVLEARVDCPMDTVCNGASYFCAPDSCVFGEFSRVGPGGLCDARTCDLASAIRCEGVGSDARFDARRTIVDPEQLPLLKRALEAQLEEIRKAEQALADRGSSR